MSVNIPLIDPSENVTFTLDWTDVIGELTLGTVTHNVPAPLTKSSESTDAANKRSSVKVSGAIHGALYMIEGQATLSNGDVVNQQFPLRCFNG